MDLSAVVRRSRVFFVCAGAPLAGWRQATLSTRSNAAENKDRMPDRKKNIGNEHNEAQTSCHWQLHCSLFWNKGARLTTQDCGCLNLELQGAGRQAPICRNAYDK